jgi:amino acid transporter
MTSESENVALLSENGNPNTATPEKKALSRLSLISVIYFLVCGGAYGTEDLGGAIPAFYGLLGILLIPWVWSLPIALIVAELGSAMPDTGGFLYWVKIAFGEFPSFIDGWIVNLTVVVDQTIYPLIFVSYLEPLVSFTPWSKYLVCLGFIALCLLINLLGAGSVGNSSKIFSAATLAPFIIYTILAFSAPQFTTGPWFVTYGTWDPGLYLSVLIWATCGYEYAGFLIADVRNPAKNFPIAMVGVVGLMTATYLLPIAATVGTAGDPSLIHEGAYPFLAEELGYGYWLVYILMAGGIMSSLGTYNAYLRTSSTALQSMAIEGHLPRFFAWQLPKFQTPWVCLVFYSITTSVLVNFDFSTVVGMEAILYSSHAILLCCTFIRLKFKEPDMPRPFAVPFGKPGAIILCLGAICGPNRLIVFDFSCSRLHGKDNNVIYTFVISQSLSSISVSANSFCRWLESACWVLEPSYI